MFWLSDLLLWQSVSWKGHLSHTKNSNNQQEFILSQCYLLSFFNRADTGHNVLPHLRGRVQGCLCPVPGPTSFAGQPCQTLFCLKVDPVMVKSIPCFTAKGISFSCIETWKPNKSFVSENRKQLEYVFCETRFI